MLTSKQRAIAAVVEKYPDMPARSIARKLVNDHPANFPSIDAARTSVRQYFGTSGKISKRVAEKRGTARAARKAGELPPLPVSEAKPWEPYILNAKRVLILSDIHIPYADDVALRAALDYGDKFKPDCILFNGDVFDFYSISRFDKDPSKPKIAAELEAGKMLFTHCRKRFPRAKLVFKLGNHDERFDLYLMRAAPILFELPTVRDAWHELAGIPENKVEVVAGKRPIMLGKLMVLHGHEKGVAVIAAVNQARGAFLRLLCSALESHGHRQSVHTERSADDRQTTNWSTGCLCDRRPDYAPYNKWTSGFATVVVAKDGNFEVSLKQIIDGRVY